MGFFDALFPNRPSAVEDKAFTDFFNLEFARYFSIADPDFHADLDNKFGDPVLPQQAFPSVYEEFGKTGDVWDMRTVLFSALDQHYLLVIERWQAVERFVIDRFPEKALAYIKQFGQPEDFDDADFLTSYARCMFVLSRLDEGLKYAQKAIEIQPANRRAQLALADILHLKGQTQTAHDIYKKVVAESKLAQSEMQHYGLFDLVCFRNDIAYSSVYAVGLLKSSEAPESEWEKVAPEFYHCPYFRSQYAFFLIRNKKALKGLEVLVAAAKAFPTFRDAVVNAHSVIKQYQKQSGKDVMREDEVFLDGVMAKNGWKLG
jgi:tetratricopeptide (TPR) repeat protein